MIAYVTLGTNDLARASDYYDELLAILGATRVMEDDHFIAWTNAEGNPLLTLIEPHDGNAQTVGNGVMVALAAKSREDVDLLYAKGIELGGKDEGPAGQRYDGFYAGYFRDLDGNKLAVVAFV